MRESSEPQEGERRGERVAGRSKRKRLGDASKRLPLLSRRGRCALSLAYSTLVLSTATFSENDNPGDESSAVRTSSPPLRSERKPSK